MTPVKIDEVLELPGNNRYEPIAIIDHRGYSINSGHYVTYSKNESGDWTLLNDTEIKPSSLHEANSKDNYIILIIHLYV